ncbi:Peroxidase 65 [Ananas comosus]|uniref:Peroxidase n=1 Tax=Ananas comosus TaxID=4615 RepID=A0A199UPC8_ANACO|nr:Peroxidase 65 [Ananas comosus]
MILTLTLTLTLGSGSGAPRMKVRVKLRASYYRRTCPGAERIVAEAVTAKQIANPSTAAGALRVFFHDCFAGGCDASLLISPDSGPGSGSSAAAERDAEINRSLPGDAFDAVARAKAALEQACPGAVSCADVLALATRHLVSMLGGPFYPLRLGRRDAPSPPPPPPPTASRSKKWSPSLEFAGRIYNFENRGPNAFDPALNPRFAQGLQRACASYLKDPTISTFNDVMTPGKFDNLYFQNLPRGLGLLASDAALFVDTRTRPFVERYAANQTAFFEDFALAMEKLSAYGVKTGRDGEVRRRCDAFNDHP